MDNRKNGGMPGGRHELTRREILEASTATVLIGALPVLGTACSKSSSAASSSAPTASAASLSSDVIRVASVPTAVEGNLLPTLIAGFEKGSPYKVALTTSNDVYGLAASGLADLVVSHFGHRGTEAFVLAGHGEWPRTLFSNQMALVGPPSDPAKVRGLQDAGEAFRRIASAKAPFVLNHIEGVQYLSEILWNAAGRPDRTGWFLDLGKQKDEAIRIASDKGAYSLWGLTPFLRSNREAKFNLEPLVLGDPLLQRLLVSVVVKPAPTIAVNSDGALALETFFLSPVTQARIRDVTYPGTDHVQWVPAGRHNRSAILPKG